MCKPRREGAFQAGANCHGGAAPSTRMPAKADADFVGRIVTCRFACSDIANRRAPAPAFVRAAS
jgi:hypothetical protein